MTETEMLLRDIDTLRASIQNNWIDLSRHYFNLSPQEQNGIRENVAILSKELASLLDRLWALEEEAAEAVGTDNERA